jgi:phage terminase large subunit
MAVYQIAELRDGEKGGFAPRGAVKTLWQSRDFETIVAGPAETGKTWGCLQYADALLWKYPGAQGVMARKTYASLVASAVRTYSRIIGNHSPIKPYGGEKPEWFQYPNGSRLWVAGLDNPGKALSTERDFIYINQAEEVSLDDWQILTTRCTGRGATMPYTRIFADCNPGPPSHWIKQRESLRLLESRHEDNPTLYDDDLHLTPQGEVTMNILGALTGVHLQRLRFGRWVQAEGAVYEEWDAAVHIVDQLPKGWETWRKIRAIDFGFTNPFVCLWIAIDPDGRMWVYREIYMTGRTVRDHAKQIRELSEGETYEATLADHDAEDRATLHQEGIPTRAAYKGITVGIQALQERLRKAGDGKARFFVLRSCLVERDDSLHRKRQPCSILQEPEVYVWPQGVDGKPVKEAPVDMNNHGLDAARYGVAYVDKLPRAREMQFL